MRKSPKQEMLTRWLVENNAMLEANYPGMWVAIGDGELAGVGETLEEAVAAATAKGVLDPVVLGVKEKAYQGIPLIRGCR
jgi:hypothetical protein